MLSINDQEFHRLVAKAIDAVPAPYSERLNNIAFIVEAEPSPQQARKLNLSCNDLLFGLYEGVPLPARMGGSKTLPDKITIFKRPLEAVSQSKEDLEARVHHTVWHEVAHYFGLDHRRIHELENKHLPN